MIDYEGLILQRQEERDLIDDGKDMCDFCGEDPPFDPETGEVKPCCASCVYFLGEAWDG